MAVFFCQLANVKLIQKLGGFWRKTERYLWRVMHWQQSLKSSDWYFAADSAACLIYLLNLLQFACQSYFSTWQIMMTNFISVQNLLKLFEQFTSSFHVISCFGARFVDFVSLCENLKSSNMDNLVLQHCVRIILVVQYSSVLLQLDWKSCFCKIIR